MFLKVTFLVYLPILQFYLFMYFHSLYSYYLPSSSPSSSSPSNLILSIQSFLPYLYIFCPVKHTCNLTYIRFDTETSVFFSSLETKKVLKIQNETFLRITRYQPSPLSQEVFEDRDEKGESISNNVFQRWKFSVRFLN